MKGRSIIIIITLFAMAITLLVVWHYYGAEEKTAIVRTPSPVSVNSDQREIEDQHSSDDKTATVSQKKEDVIIPTKEENEVVFVVQAPKGQWENELFQDACEEASVLMAGSWLIGSKQKFSKDEATRELEKMFAFERENYGQAYDLSAKDTAQFLRDYYKTQDVTVIYDITTHDIVRALADGKIVIVPSNGQKLGNPYFTAPGPERHMLVITGYDQKKQEYITNDPGTRRGAGFRYDYDTLIAAVRDYPTGHKELITEEKTVMIVVGPHEKQD